MTSQFDVLFIHVAKPMFWQSLLT